jgi:hypothetical protein
MAYMSELAASQYYLAAILSRPSREQMEEQLIENSRKEIDCIRRGLPPDAWKNKT